VSVRSWIKKKYIERLEKKEAARLAEERAAAKAVIGNPLYALDDDHAPGEVTAQYQGALADLEEARQAKMGALSSAKRVQAMAEKITDKDQK
jgi:hypothetical protein